MTKHRATARRAVWVVTLLLTSVEVTPALGQRDLVYGENFDAGQARGWILEPGWSIEYGALVGRGHSWARYGGAVWGGSAGGASG